MSELQTRAEQSASLWQHNPVLLHLFGLSPLLAISTDLASGIGLGIVNAVILVLAALSISLTGTRLRGPWRFLGYLLLLAALTTMLAALCARYFAPLATSLGIYLPLLCCNFVILVRLDTYRDQAWAPCLFDALRVAGGYLLALVLLAALREWLTTGAVLTRIDLLWPAGADHPAAANPSSDVWPFIRMAPAAFILLGLLIAAKNWLDSLLPARRGTDDSDIKPVPRARVTGKLKGS